MQIHPPSTTDRSHAGCDGRILQPGADEDHPDELRLRLLRRTRRPPHQQREIQSPEIGQSGHDLVRYPSKFQSCLIGAGGSIAFLFFIAAIGGLNEFNTLNEYLRVISVSVIAGFGAQSLLPRMVGNLERQLSEVDNKMSRVGHQVEEVRDEAQSAVRSAQEAITQRTMPGSKPSKDTMNSGIRST